jgi:hypothetical protein
VPQWWEAIVTRARFSGNEWVGFTPGRSRAKYRDVGGGVLASSPIRVVSEEGDQVIIGVRVGEIAVAKQWLEQAPGAKTGGFKAVGAITHGASVDGDYIAFHDTMEGRYVLLLVDRDTRGLRWSTSVWAGIARILGRTGAGYWHHIEIIEAAGRVYVFGATNFVIYIEAFDKSDGTNLFRFSSSYDDPPHEL